MSRNAQTLKVLLADDHPVVLYGLRELIQADQGFEVVATFSNGEEALRAIRELQPDLALLDVSMPGMTGIEVLRAIRAEGIEVPVVFLTATVSDDQIVTAMALGVRGIVLKDTAPDVLAECLRSISVGGKWLPRDLIEPALKRQAERRGEMDRVEKELTPREREIALLTAEGLSNKAIGRKLNVSEGTVKIHLHNIFQKLNVSNRTSLAALALEYRDKLTR